MKIVYAGLRYGPDGRDPSFAHVNFYLPLTQLVAHQVVAYYHLERLESINSQVASHELRETVQKEKPDLLFIAGLNHDLDKDTIASLKKETVVAAVFFDEDTDLYQRSLAWAPALDWIVTFYPPAAAEYRARGHNVIGIDWFINTDCYRPLPGRTYRYDVSFIGAAKPERERLFRRLEKEGITITAWGRGWPGGMITFDHMIRVFNESRINLNWGQGKSVWRWQTLLRIFFAPARNRLGAKLDWKNAAGNWRTILNRRHPQSRARPFEIAACRSLALTNHAPVFAPWKDGEDTVYFADEADLIEKIRYYLYHPSERERITANAYQLMQVRHSAGSCLARILDKIAKNPMTE